MPFEATLDLGQPTEIHSVYVHALKHSRFGVLFPSAVEFQVSNDGTQFDTIATVKPEPAQALDALQMVKADGLHARGRYVKIIARQGGFWVFLDEVLINPASDSAGAARWTGKAREGGGYAPRRAAGAGTSQRGLRNPAGERQKCVSKKNFDWTIDDCTASR